MVWYNGISQWTVADKIDELKKLLSSQTPPPFHANASVPPPLSKVEATEQYNHQYTPKKKDRAGVILQSIGAILLIFILVLIFYKSGSSADGNSQTYQEKVMTVEEIERSQPSNFLAASGSYSKNFWNDKFKVHGIVKNNATVVSYKDAVVKITYYSKTRTELASKEYIIYDNFPPHSEVKFELKIDNYKNVSTIGWEVVKATAN